MQQLTSVRMIQIGRFIWVRSAMLALLTSFIAGVFIVPLEKAGAFVCRSSDEGWAIFLVGLSVGLFIGLFCLAPWIFHMTFKKRFSGFHFEVVDHQLNGTSV